MTVTKTLHSLLKFKTKTKSIHTMYAYRTFINLSGLDFFILEIECLHTI